MTHISNVYAQALYDLACSEKLEKQVLQQLQVISRCFEQTPEYLRLLSVPNLSKQERCGILDDCFRGNIHSYVLNFLKILTEKGYIRQFHDCCEAFQTLYNQDHGILPVIAVTAIPLSPEQSRRLTEKLSAVTGKTIELDNQVEPAVLGGIRLDYDGKRLDDTIAHRLNAIRSLLSKTVL